MTKFQIYAKKSSKNNLVMNYCHYFVWQIVLYTTNDNASMDALMITEITN